MVLMADETTSLTIRESSPAPERIHLCLDASSNIVIMDANGTCQAYEGRSGSPLGPCITPEAFSPREDVGQKPPDGMILSDVWALGDGRWFGWANEHEGGGRDGSAWLYEAALTRWVELPRAHHHQVWHAAGLSDGGFASLGMNSNVGALAIWASPDDPEIITIPHGPGAKGAGLVELTDGSLLVWPFKDDESAAILKRSGGSRDLWNIWALPGSEGVIGAISVPSHDNSSRLVTWTPAGEVRLWMTERLPAPLKHRSSRAGKAIHTPHHLKRVERNLQPRAVAVRRGAR